MSRAAPATSIRKLVDRVSTLEQEVADLREKFRSRPFKDWRTTIGMFGNDPVMKQVLDEAAKYRERDRARARAGRRAGRPQRASK